MYDNRPHVADIRAMKKRGEKISMLFVTTPKEAARGAERNPWEQGRFTVVGFVFDIHISTNEFRLISQGKLEL